MVPLDHTDGLFAYAMALTRNTDEAEDLVQETYLRALQAIRQQHEYRNAKAWLYAILRNLRLNQVRQLRTRPQLFELDADESFADLVVETAKDPHALYASKLEKQQVREAIQQLSNEFREVIVLREFAELSYQEIAALLHCPAGTVMSRLARARQKLRTVLSNTAERTSLKRNDENAVAGGATQESSPIMPGDDSWCECLHASVVVPE